MAGSTQSSSEQPRCCIDHIVLLLSPADFESPPRWLSDNFTIINGGTHTGGSSRNKLIIFKDGTYLELFEWLDKSVENFPDWMWRPEGSYIDYALMTLPPVDAEKCWDAVEQDLEHDSNGVNVKYEKPNAGGRKKPDGTEIAWKTSRPKYTDEGGKLKPGVNHDRLDMPFFCHDTTERTLRVPHNDSEITTHPCGAFGMSNIDVVVPKDLYSKYVKTHAAVLGRGPTNSNSNVEAVFDVGVPDPSYGNRPTISLRPEEADNGYLNGDPALGIRGVDLFAPRLNGQRKSLIGGLARTDVPVLILQG